VFTSPYGGGALMSSVAVPGARRPWLSNVKQPRLTGPGIDDVPQPGASFTRDGVTIYLQPAEKLYGRWPRPVCIVVDGPYGVRGFPGDLRQPQDLTEWYRPHIRAWSARATPQTTLWFWNTEIGWATVHPVLAAHGWEYRCCHIWNKGPAHVAGNANSRTLRQFPIVTEICVQYVRSARFTVGGSEMSMQEWLRHEWMRSGLALHSANDACGVRNAATRKYLTADHLWYYPPVEAFERMAAYVNSHGEPAGRPYFSVDGKRPLCGDEWAKLRAKFHCEFGVSNVWSMPPMRGPERLKRKCKCIHNNQKPLDLIRRIVRVSTDEGDVVWEPFGGLCTVAVAAHSLRRRCVSAEINPEFFLAAKERLETHDAK